MDDVHEARETDVGAGAGGRLSAAVAGWRRIEVRIGVIVILAGLATGLWLGADGDAGVQAIARALAPSLEHETPNPGDFEFAARVAKWQKQTGASEVEATFLRVLQDAPVMGEETRRLIEGARRRSLRVGTDPKSAWLGSLATRLYGPKGPRVEQG